MNEHDVSGFSDSGVDTTQHLVEDEVGESLRASADRVASSVAGPRSTCRERERIGEPPGEGALVRLVPVPRKYKHVTTVT
jgi:hypothetical protein